MQLFHITLLLIFTQQFINLLRQLRRLFYYTLTITNHLTQVINTLLHINTFNTQFNQFLINILINIIHILINQTQHPRTTHTQINTTRRTLIDIMRYLPHIIQLIILQLNLLILLQQFTQINTTFINKLLITITLFQLPTQPKYLLKILQTSFRIIQSTLKLILTTLIIFPQITLDSLQLFLHIR